jgi:hypothetical protein
MIRYSSYGSGNYRTNQSAPTELLCPLEEEYRELQDLRERVRMAAARDAPCAIKKSALPLIEQRSRDEMRHRLSRAVLVIAIVLAMTGWVYALGWVVLKLI